MLQFAAEERVRVQGPENQSWAREPENQSWAQEPGNQSEEGERVPARGAQSQVLVPARVQAQVRVLVRALELARAPGGVQVR